MRAPTAMRRREWADDEWESVFAAIVADGPHDSGSARRCRSTHLGPR